MMLEVLGVWEFFLVGASTYLWLSLFRWYLRCPRKSGWNKSRKESSNWTSKYWLGGLCSHCSEISRNIHACIHWHRYVNIYIYIYIKSIYAYIYICGCIKSLKPPFEINVRTSLQNKRMFTKNMRFLTSWNSHGRSPVLLKIDPVWRGWLKELWSQRFESPNLKNLIRSWFSQPKTNFSMLQCSSPVGGWVSFRWFFLFVLWESGFGTDISTEWEACWNVNWFMPQFSLGWIHFNEISWNCRWTYLKKETRPNSALQRD